MNVRKTMRPMPPHRRAGFTLIEFVVASAIGVLVFASLAKGYNLLGRRVQYAAYNLAANTIAQQEMESMIAAPWIPSQDNLQLFSSAPTPFSENLCLPEAAGITHNCYVTSYVAQVSVTPPYALIKVQVIWTNVAADMGIFTNTLVTLRAPNSP